MNIEFLEKFEKDLDKITSETIKDSLDSVIAEVETATKLSDINNLKKMKGYKDAYRIRLGDYRIGIFFENNTLIFARFIHRKDIYKFFP